MTFSYQDLEQHAKNARTTDYVSFVESFIEDWNTYLGSQVNQFQQTPDSPPLVLTGDSKHLQSDPAEEASKMIEDMNFLIDRIRSAHRRLKKGSADTDLIEDTITSLDIIASRLEHIDDIIDDALPDRAQDAPPHIREAVRTINRHVTEIKADANNILGDLRLMRRHHDKEKKSSMSRRLARRVLHDSGHVSR